MSYGRIIEGKERSPWKPLEGHRLLLYEGALERLKRDAQIASKKAKVILIVVRVMLVVMIIAKGDERTPSFLSQLGPILSGVSFFYFSV